MLMTNGARIFDKSAWNFEIVLERCSYVFNYFLADMFINSLGFIDFLISDHTRNETLFCSMLNFCSKVKKVFKRAGNVKYCSKFKKVPKKCSAQSGNAYFLAQIFKILAGELRYLNTQPVLRATPVTTYTRIALSQKSREAVKAHGWE